jgi:hypothetical protein
MALWFASFACFFAAIIAGASLVFPPKSRLRQFSVHHEGVVDLKGVHELQAGGFPIVMRGMLPSRSGALQRFQ